MRDEYVAARHLVRNAVLTISSQFVAKAPRLLEAAQGPSLERGDQREDDGDRRSAAAAACGQLRRQQAGLDPRGLVEPRQRLCESATISLPTTSLTWHSSSSPEGRSSPGLWSAATSASASRKRVSSLESSV